MAEVMTRPGNNMAKKTTPVRLSEEAMRWARIASGYTGESASEYVSRVVAERGKADAERLHAEAVRQAQAEGKRPKPPGRAGGS